MFPVLVEFKTSFFQVSMCFNGCVSARQQWMLDSDSELDFDGFVAVEFGENGHFPADLASGIDVD